MQKIKKPSEDFFKFLDTVNQLHGVLLPARNPADPYDKDVIFEVIQKYPALYQFVFGKSTDEEITLTEIRIGLWERYEPFRLDRVLLLRIVEELATVKVVAVEDLLNKSLPAKNETIVENISVTGVVIINKKGQLRLEENILRRFDGIDVTRLRICSICSNIFWASRTDKKHCSKCSNFAAQKAYQKRNREAINFQRRHNYRVKTERKRRKNNGTL